MSLRPGAVAHTCNPSTLGGWRGGGGSPGVKSSRPAWPTWWNPVSTKNTKISQVYWCRPVILATGGLRQEDFSNPGGRGCSEPSSCHCTPAWVTRMKLCLQKKKDLKIILAFCRNSENIWKAVISSQNFKPNMTCCRGPWEKVSYPKCMGRWPGWYIVSCIYSRKSMNCIFVL